MNTEKPRKLWVCNDCGTVSDETTSSTFHLGHVGRIAKPQKSFWQSHRSQAHRTGEQIWVKEMRIT